MARLELESGTDVLLLESGDALLLEIQEYEVNSAVDTGIVVTASRLSATARSAAIDTGIAVTATRRVDYKRTATFDR